MAEFKDISLFQTITPTWNSAANLFLQVSATEKVSLQSIASLGANAILGNNFGSSTGNLVMPVTSADTIISALKKIANTGKNQPFRVVSSNDNRGIALCMGGFGIYIYRASDNYNDIWMKIRSFSSDNWKTDSDETIIEYLNNTKENLFYFPQYQLRDATTSVSNLKSGDVYNVTSQLNSVTINSGRWSPNLNSALIYAPTCKCPKANIKLKDGTQTNLFFMEGFDDVCADGTQVCITVQYIGKSGRNPKFLINACSYNNE